MDSDYQLQPNLNLTRVFVFKVDAFTIRRHHGSNFKIAYTTFFLIILVSEGSICFSSTLITWSLINLTTATKCLNFSSPQRHELTTMHHELATMLEYEAQKLLPPYVHTYVGTKQISHFAGMRVRPQGPHPEYDAARFARSN